MRKYAIEDPIENHCPKCHIPLLPGSALYSEPIGKAYYLLVSFLMFTVAYYNGFVSGNPA